MGGGDPFLVTTGGTSEKKACHYCGEKKKEKEVHSLYRRVARVVECERTSSVEDCTLRVSGCAECFQNRAYFLCRYNRSLYRVSQIPVEALCTSLCPLVPQIKLTLTVTLLFNKISAFGMYISSISPQVDTRQWPYLSSAFYQASGLRIRTH